MSDWDRARRGGFPVRRPERESGARVAIVGSGRRGWPWPRSCARPATPSRCSKPGPCPGGCSANGIPSFKTEYSIVDDKIDALVQAGVEFRCNTHVGRDVTWDDLARYDAVFLAQGAGLGKRLRLQGARLKHVYTATDFLVRANLPDDMLPPRLSGQPHVGRSAVVVGGGDTSMDCVRSAIRMGVEQVTLLYRARRPRCSGVRRNAATPRKRA